MPKWWLTISIKFVSPVVLSVLFVLNIITLFVKNGGKYGYPLWAEIAGGWVITVLVFLSGFIIKCLAKKKGIEEKDISWDD